MLFDLGSRLIALYIVILFVRIVIDLVRALARDWRPKGIGLILSELIYTLTDPPLRALRKVIPSLTLGRVRLDLSFMVLVIICWFLSGLLGSLSTRL